MPPQVRRARTPCFCSSGPGSGRRNDHDPVVNRGGDSGPMLVDIVVGLERVLPKSTSGRAGVEIFPSREIAVLALEVVLWICRRTSRSVQRPACEYQNGLSVGERSGKILDREARRVRNAVTAATGQEVGRNRKKGLAIPLVRKEPSDIRVRVSWTRGIGRGW